MRRSNLARLIIFVVGLSVPATASLWLLKILLKLATGLRVMLIEPNRFVIAVEAGLQVVGIASCMAALWVYFKYLKLQEIMSADNSEKETDGEKPIQRLSNG